MAQGFIGGKKKMLFLTLADSTEIGSDECKAQ
jgi:hypothetical protein